MGGARGYGGSVEEAQKTGKKKVSDVTDDQRVKLDQQRRKEENRDGEMRGRRQKGGSCKRPGGRRSRGAYAQSGGQRRQGKGADLKGRGSSR